MALKIHQSQECYNDIYENLEDYVIQHNKKEKKEDAFIGPVINEKGIIGWVISDPESGSIDVYYNELEE